MEILFFQIGIFVLIQLSCLFGKSARNGLSLILTIFTILAVFTNSLLIIQLLTILISYMVSNSWFSESTVAQTQTRKDTYRVDQNNKKSVLPSLPVADWEDIEEEYERSKVKATSKSKFSQEQLDLLTKILRETPVLPDFEVRELLEKPNFKYAPYNSFNFNKRKLQLQNENINRNTEFYFYHLDSIYGPVKAYKLKQLILEKKISRSSLVKQKHEKHFEITAGEILEVIT